MTKPEDVLTHIYTRLRLIQECIEGGHKYEEYEITDLVRFLENHGVGSVVSTPGAGFIFTEGRDG